MALSQALNNKLNEQITNEFYASQLYLAMSCALEERGLRMLAKLYRKQAEEERGHALKILDYIPQVEGTVRLQAIPQPPAEFESPQAMIQAALDHERKVTAQINELMMLAEKEKDFASRVLLRWFVEEQVEEVDNQLHLLQVAKMAGPSILQLEAYVAHLVK